MSEDFDNLDDLDWSDVEEELKNNREQIVSDAEEAAAAHEEDTGGLPAEVAAGDGGANEQVDINFLLDVQLELMVEVGQTNILIEDLLKLEQQSVIELNSLVGKPLDVKVNENLVAHGEIVVINEKFGIRITDIVSPKQRFASLK